MEDEEIKAQEEAQEIFGSADYGQSILSGELFRIWWWKQMCQKYAGRSSIVWTDAEASFEKDFCHEKIEEKESKNLVKIKDAKDWIIPEGTPVYWDKDGDMCFEVFDLEKENKNGTE